MAAGIQVAKPAALQLISAPETATYPTSMAAMDARNLPTREVVIRDGQPVWRICGQGICVEDRSGTRAEAEFLALCRSMGVEPPSSDQAPPRRGPSEVDEPGV